jgi:PAS domain-containing protein/HPt (histidine-containing phosphotransfer) domain-containing protein
LAAAQHALKICPSDFKDDQMKIYRQLTQVHETRGSFEAAFQALRNYVELEQSSRTEQSRKDYLELRNQSLFQQNEMQEQQIQLLKKFRIVSVLAVGLSLGLFLALTLVWRQSSALRRSRQKIKDILDHIDEGIVTLDRHLHIQSAYSPYLHRIFGDVSPSFEGWALLDLLFPAHSAQADQRILVKETLLSCMGEQSLTWEFNHGHLPHEIRHQDKVLEVHWQALYNSHRLISSYLVTIRDISSIKRMQEDMEQESRRVTSLQKKLEEILKGNSSLIRSFIQDLKQSWDHMGDQIYQRDQQTAVLRRLHTWKGSARTLGLNDLASGLHVLESQVLDSDFDQRRPQEQAWKALSLSFEDYHHLLHTLMVGHKSEALAPRNLYAFADLYAREMRTRLDAVACPQLGVMVLDHVDAWNPDLLPRVHEIVLHALTNALDHGFIRPLQKRRQVEPAMIQILAYRSVTHLELLVRDNGVGLDWEKLQQKAAEMAFVPMKGQSLADVLFMDGVSTADSLTETSGRGVGLSSVRSLCVEMGGQTFLEDNPSGGAVLRLEFPLSILLDSAA